MLHADETGCRTDLTLDARFQGWEGVAHGGILCTILDEVMAWAVIGRDVWGVTARMTVDFRRPVPVGRALRAEGTVTQATRRLFRTEGRILDAETGEVLASSEGAYVAAPPERLAELKARYRMRPVDGSPAVDWPMRPNGWTRDGHGPAARGPWPARRAEREHGAGPGVRRRAPRPGGSPGARDRRARP